MAGRPRVEISLAEFKKLCGLQCTLEEIAGFFDCSGDTIERWCKRELGISFADAFKKFSAGGRISLRRNQFRLAEKSASMAIFLGKNYLGQRDNIETEDNAALDKLDEILRANRENAIQQEAE